MQYANSPAARKKARMARWVFVLIVTGAVVFLGFQTYVYAAQIVMRRDTAINKRPPSVSPDNLQYSWKLFKILDAQSSATKGNTAFSPFGTSCVLGILLLAVNSTSHGQIRKILQVDHSMPDQTVHKTLGFLLHDLTSSSGVFNLTNVLDLPMNWTQFDAEGFANAAHMYHFKQRVLTNDSSISENRSSEITRGFNVTLTSALDLTLNIQPSPDKIFQVVNTTELFHISNQKSTLVPMLHIIGKLRTGYDKTLDCDLLELLIAGTAFNLTILTPRKHIALSLIQDRLVAMDYSFSESILKVAVVDALIPLINNTIEVGLKDMLTSLGVHGIFDKLQTGFSVNEILQSNHITITGDINTSSDVYHLPTNSTATLVKYSANKPFLYIVSHLKAGVLLLGRTTHL